MVSTIDRFSELFAEGLLSTITPVVPSTRVCTSSAGCATVRPSLSQNVHSDVAAEKHYSYIIITMILWSDHK
jgi:hypothetical protein